MRTYKVKCDGCNPSVINGISCHEQGCHDVLKYVYRGKEYLKFRIWSLDVWGSIRDGFEVNDRSECGQVLIRSDLSNRDIITALKRKELLNKKAHLASFSVDGDGRTLIINARKTLAPYYELEVV